MAVQAEAPARARPATATREQGRRFSPGKIALYAVLILIAMFFIIPLLWMVSTSLKVESQVFTDRGFIPANPSTEQNADEARAICGRCLCRAECAEYALADPTLLGIWAGSTTAERRMLRRRSAA